ncbi:MAG: hypothetical protein HY241_01910 [Actinobacteria bacterium]|nr:hypothetical protein [Actinomycetota bacterium]
MRGLVRPWWLPRWSGGPALPGGALLVAVVVSLMHGQPPPVDRPVGVSIPVRSSDATPVGLGRLTVVSGGRALRVDPLERRSTAISLPAGARVLDVVAGHRAQALLVRFPSGRTVCYLVPAAGGAIRLGDARAVVPDTSNQLFWLDTGDQVRAYLLDGVPAGPRVAVPEGFVPVGGVHGQIIASSAGEEPQTLLLSESGRREVLFAGQALDVAGGVVLLRMGNQLAVFDLRSGELTRLPSLSAVRITGPGRLAGDGAGFAVLGRVNDHAQLVIGPIAPRSEAELQVVSLDGGAPLPYPPAASWTGNGSVLAVRPDGRLVFFTPGRRNGVVLDGSLPAVSGVALAG